MCSGFVPASQLYDVENRTPIVHPAHQATDEDVRRALADREVRADGGIDHSSSGTDQSPFSSTNDFLPQRQNGTLLSRINFPLGRRWAGYTAPQPVHTAETSAVRRCSVIEDIPSDIGCGGIVTGDSRSLNRLLGSDTEREDGDSR